MTEQALLKANGVLQEELDLTPIFAEFGII